MATSRLEKIAGDSRPAPAPAVDTWALAPFDGASAAEVRALVAKLTAAQRLWLSGYLCASADGSPAAAADANPGAAPVTILFGSQTGNSQLLAQRLAARLAEQRVPHRVLDMLDCRKKDLESAEALLIVVSTHGDGDPPDRALAFHELLHGRKSLRLANVRYSVLALGDSSYEKFCETGRQFDDKLEALGARRLEPRVDCDVDFDAPAQQWIDAVAAKLAAATDAAQRPGAGAQPADTARRPSTVANAYTRKNPFQSTVLANQRLTARGSSKDVRHIELSLDGSNIRYEPGDAIGIVPRNSEADVDALLAASGFAADTAVVMDAHAVPLRDALRDRFEIGTLSGAFVRRYAAAVDDAELAAFSTRELELARYVHGRDLVDLVTAHPPRGVDAEAFVKLLRPLAPRLYSIASSAAVTPDEAHLTVGLVEYESLGRRRRGVVSGTLAALPEDASAPIYLHRNTAFRLPADPAADVVMIGAGTGVAPFRAFLADREAAGAKGRHWLFFGDRSFELDFLYQAEWLDWRKRGLLTRLDVAFSRDQAHKVYVQHRLAEHGAELWAWLEQGAHLYVCGDAARMAPDVEHALLDVIRRHGGRGSDDEARDYLLQLQRSRRYQRDVY